jgi:hypothetical protein
MVYQNNKIFVDGYTNRNNVKTQPNNDEFKVVSDDEEDLEKTSLEESKKKKEILKKSSPCLIFPTNPIK